MPDADLDLLLRRGLAELAGVDDGRDGPPRPSPAELERDVTRRAARRRRRRRRTTTGAVAAALTLSLAGGALLGDPPDLVTSDAPSDPSSDVPPGGDPRQDGPGTGDAGPAPAEPVRVVAVDADGGPAGTERIVIHFDGPIPTDPPVPAPGLVPGEDRPDTPGIAYTAQPPDGLRVCGSTHWFPGDQGTIDVLVPAAWLVPGGVGDDVPLRPGGTHPPAKVVWCEPQDGYVQFGVWGPASDELGDVRAHVTGDGTALVVEIDPG